MWSARRLRCLSATLALGIVGCGSGGGGAAPTSSSVGSSPAPSASQAASTPAPASAAPDVPEVRDEGRGRATAALRAMLAAHGIAFDASAIERECKVGPGGASIDDLEDVARKQGLDATQMILPAEHVLLPDAKVLPAIVIVAGPDGKRAFTVAWRVEGARVRIMDPARGRAWVNRAELERRLHVHEMAVSADSFRSAAGSPAFLGALGARMATIGVDPARRKRLIERAAADPGVRGVGALDAAIRLLERDTSGAAHDGGGRLEAAFGCAFEERCDGVRRPPEALWSVRAKGAGAAEQVVARGTVLLAISGRLAP
jgi:hypothetical protein